MTLAVTVVCQDGIVVAADSRTTISNSTWYRIGSDFTHKVFQSGGVAVATYGEAFLLGRSISSHMAEFAATEVGSCDHPESAAQALAQFFGERYGRHLSTSGLPSPPSGVTALGFLVGGYAPTGVGELWEVSIPDQTTLPVATTQNGGGAAWRGQTDVVTRIVRGADIDLIGAIAGGNGLATEYEALRPVLDACGYRIPFDTMNLQDGIDFAVLCIRTTIDVQRLTLGTVAQTQFSWPGVGGPIEIATVSPGQRFEWVQRTLVQGERAAGQAEG
jgi:hypothetical protein